MKHSIVIAADKSGSGKTTLTCGLIHVLKKRGLKVQSFKCGPDYIDPMFHRKVLGVSSANLDSFFVEPELLRQLYEERAGSADISVIEGVMGYYDGLGGVSTKGSTWEVAGIIGSPTVLVMDCKGGSVSIAALMRGMLDFSKHRGGSGIRGVILNRVSPMFYERLKGLIEDACPEVKVLGYLPEIKEYNVPSRHLGLISPEEMDGFYSWIEALGETIEKNIDIDGIIELASSDNWMDSEKNSIDSTGMPESDKSSDHKDNLISDSISSLVLENADLKNEAVQNCCGENIPLRDFSKFKLSNTVRLGIAEDEAFSFYYQENKDILEKMGGELVSFSPLHDERLPEDLDGLIIGGGYPELYAEALSANVYMRNSIAQAVNKGLSLIAECGGYMYLNKSICTDDTNGYSREGNVSMNPDEECCEMCGVFSGELRKQDRLVRFGYIEAETKTAGLFGPAGTVLRGHEFHRFDCADNGAGFSIRKPSAGTGKAKTAGKIYDGIFYDRSKSAGWPHFYYYSNPEAIFNFMKNCERFKIERAAQQKWDSIGKPIDSLGVLEKHVIKLCGIQRTLEPSVEKRALVVLCADHGCVKEGVTQTDSSVTRKVADSFVKGATTTSIFAKGNDVDVYTVDVGMIGPRYSDSENFHFCNAKLSRSADGKTADSDVKNSPDQKNSLNFQKLRQDVVNDRRLMDGSGNIAVEAAMDEETGRKALQLGRDIVSELKEEGYDIIATGEMGIGNTTPTAALLAYFMGASAEEAVGYGAGLSEEGLRRKQDVVRRALERLEKLSLSEEAKEYRVFSRDTAEKALFQIGGPEIAVMAGMFLGAVEHEVPIIIDGIISTAAALSAFMMDERVSDYAFASHISKEKLAGQALERMDLRAIIDAEMSLGEGSGAVLLIPLLSAAVDAFNKMGTFKDIDVKAYHRFK
ncbi:cobyrinic acid a,c-diamide synthase [Oribacterium sp. C9]|uniref:cobyrinate a,c-diamide synthase n=1 Tax=Oribacterium sp. C9 TaxID=1943579 RepID=UPI00098E9289|nr:cobyrinate a,c-diamide synthase [Oribacterium sp. C9]OON86969.1 cobyrinic acid a,c-diamide synthase [Oribacterium sp. C9]